jgi:hypothetical protein
VPWDVAQEVWPYFLEVSFLESFEIEEACLGEPQEVLSVSLRVAPTSKAQDR